MKRIDIEAAKKLQVYQLLNAIIVSGTVPAVGSGGTAISIANISAQGDFCCDRVTGKFSTLYDDGGVVKDDGTNHLTCRIKDSSSQELFDDFVPLDLFLSPGRVRTMSVTIDFGAGAGTPDTSGTLFYPFPFDYIFKQSNEIQIEIKNDSNTANTFMIAFWGKRVKPMPKV